MAEPLQIVPTSRFKRDARLAQRRGKDISKLHEVITTLQSGQPLLPRHRDHNLSGEWSHHRECHIGPDWLLIYRTVGDELFLDRTGTHADLFNK